ncbi:MAG TPA: hypothetical protein VFG76_03115 [Candidatus Polarisedimenticolia bacterium]|nr:hypothetical protein [Candidatus Polarisedimenticolia bacterium]
MTHRRTWIAQAAIPALVAVGALVLIALNGLGSVSSQPHQASLGLVQTGVVHAVTSSADESLVEPAAICRLIPECGKNSDCDDRCGVGLGKCVHSNCPVRICRCR